MTLDSLSGLHKPCEEANEKINKTHTENNHSNFIIENLPEGRGSDLPAALPTPRYSTWQQHHTLIPLEKAVANRNYNNNEKQ